MVRPSACAGAAVRAVRATRPAAMVFESMVMVLRVETPRTSRCRCEVSRDAPLNRSGSGCSSAVHEGNDAPDFFTLGRSEARPEGQGTPYAEMAALGSSDRAFRASEDDDPLRQ